MKQYFLIRFQYEYYCQGYEWTSEIALVKDSTFARACAKIGRKYKSAKDFENLTIVD